MLWGAGARDMGGFRFGVLEIWFSGCSVVYIEILPLKLKYLN